MDNTANFIKQLDDILALPLSEYHRLKKALKLILDSLGADRCSLLYPCSMTTENHIIPVEATTSNYPGANALKTHLPSNPIFQHICEALEGTTTPIAFDVVGIQEPTLKKTIR